jgi:hypothetical protein
MGGLETKTPKSAGFADLDDNVRLGASLSERRAWDSNPQPVARQLILNQTTTPQNTEENADSGNSAALDAATEPFHVSFDADLRSIIDAWPDLPNALKAGIAAMVMSWKTTGPS